MVIPPTSCRLFCTARVFTPIIIPVRSTESISIMVPHSISSITTVSADWKAIIFSLTADSECIVKSVPCYIIPVCENNFQWVAWLWCETMYNIITEPVFTRNVTKSFLVFLPTAEKMYRPIKSFLYDCPYTISSKFTVHRCTFLGQSIRINGIWATYLIPGIEPRAVRIIA